MLDLIERCFIATTETCYHYWPQRLKKSNSAKQYQIISHRGEHDNVHVYENTLESFVPLVENKIWGVEFDIRWTKDLVPIVYHDDDLSRFFNDDTKVLSLTYEQLNKMHPMIPRLEEVVQQFGGKLHFVIELKDTLITSNDEAKQNFIDALSPLAASKDFHIISFDIENFNYLSNFPSQTFVPIVYFMTKQIEETVYQKNYAGVLGHFLVVNKKLIKRLQENNKLAGTGIVNSFHCMVREANRHLDWIFTDKAVELKKSMSEKIS